MVGWSLSLFRYLVSYYSRHAALRHIAVSLIGCYDHYYTCRRQNLFLFLALLCLVTPYIKVKDRLLISVVISLLCS